MGPHKHTHKRAQSPALAGLPVQDLAKINLRRLVQPVVVWATAGERQASSASKQDQLRAFLTAFPPGRVQVRTCYCAHLSQGSLLSVSGASAPIWEVGAWEVCLGTFALMAGGLPHRSCAAFLKVPRGHLLLGALCWTWAIAALHLRMSPAILFLSTVPPSFWSALW